MPWQPRIWISRPVKRAYRIVVLRFALLLAITVVVAISARAESAQPSNNSKRTIGVILAMTGPLSFQGEAIRGAMLMAKNEFDKQNKLQLIFEDDAFQARNAVTAFIKMKSNHKLDALIIFGAGTSSAVAPLAEKEKIPFISISVLESLTRDRNFVFLFMPSISRLMEKVEAEARRREYKSVAVVSTSFEASLLQSEHFKNSGVAKIVFSEEVMPGDYDLRGVATRLMSRNPDAVFLSTLPPQGSAMAKQLRELGFKGGLFGSLALASVSEVRGAQGALDGAWVVSGDDRQAGAYYQKYFERFKSRSTAEAIFGYDLIKLLSEINIESDITAALSNLKDFAGSLGTYSADGKRCFTFPVVAKNVVGETFSYID